jgi:HEAT repeat protein
MRTSKGVARIVMLSVLGLSAALVVVTVYLLAGIGGGSSSDDDPFSEGSRPLMPGSITARDRNRGGDGTDGEFDEELDDLPGDLADRERSGKVHWWTPEDLERALEKRSFEVVRYLVRKGQKNGHTISPEIVAQLVELLKSEDTRIDAKLVLGMITDDATGRTLGEFAANPAYPPEARLAALGALAESGQPAALSHLQAMAADDELEPKLASNALLALAAIDSEDAARSLVNYLRSHPDGPTSSAALTAVGKSPAAGPVLADTLRQARAEGDQDTAWLLIRAAGRQGEAAHEDLRLEVGRVVEDPSSLDFVEKESDRRKIRTSAVMAAVRMDMVEQVIRIAEHGDPEMQGVAYYGLRHARGDRAAQELAAAVDRARDAQAKRELIVAIGNTGSRKATETLVRHLDAQDRNIQQAASSGLAQVRDPKAVDPILERLGREGNHFVIDQNYVKALGRIGSKKAKPRLEELLEKAEEGDERWSSMAPWIRNALSRIESGNPDSEVLKQPEPR